MTATLRILLWGTALGALACSGPAEPSLVVEPIQITEVEVLVLESFPAQVMAHVTGVIGDGCATLLPEEVERSASEITISILRQRPADAVCTQIAKLYDERIALGTFPPGEYVLRVNDVEERFRVD